MVLSQGSLPMAVLKEVVGKWIANTLAGELADQLPFACKPRALETCTGMNVCVRGHGHACFPPCPRADLGQVVETWPAGGCIPLRVDSSSRKEPNRKPKGRPASLPAFFTFNNLER